MHRYYVDAFAGLDLSVVVGGGYKNKIQNIFLFFYASPADAVKCKILGGVCG